MIFPGVNARNTSAHEQASGAEGKVEPADQHGDDGQADAPAAGRPGRAALPTSGAADAVAPAPLLQPVVLVPVPEGRHGDVLLTAVSAKSFDFPWN